MIGKQVAEPFVTIVDDGTIPGMLGSINVDDEGTPGQKTVLVENGILTSYMHDRISARYYKVQPTGNGRRESYQHYVQPRMRNTLHAGRPGHARGRDPRRRQGHLRRRTSATARSRSARAISPSTSRRGG